MTRSTAEYDAHLEAARATVRERPDLVPDRSAVIRQEGNFFPLMRDARRRYQEATGEPAVQLLMAKLVGQVVRGEL